MPLSGAIFFNLIINPVTCTDAGYYFARVTDATGVADSAIAVLTVSGCPPVLADVLDQTVCAGTLLSFSLFATDPDPADVLTYSMSGAPAGAAMNSLSGVFAWTPTASQVGTYTVTFTVTDSGTPPLSASKSTTITVVSCTFNNGSFCTFSQGAFGSTGSYGYTAVLSPNFSALYYPFGVTVGHVGNNHMTFTTAPAVAAYLPASGTAAVLTDNLSDPTTTSARVFGGQVLTLRLSRDLSNAGVTPTGFGSVTLCNLVDDPAEDTAMNLTPAQADALNGKTINQVLTDAENVLGGSGAVSSYGLTVSQLNALVSLLNLSFDAAFTDASGMVHPCGGMSAFASAHLCP